MIKKKLSLLVLLVFLAFIGTGQFGFGGCQCPLIPVLSYEYKIPYFTANNGSSDDMVDRVALFCYVEVKYYDSQNQEIEYSDRKYLASLVVGDTVFNPPPEDIIPEVSNTYKTDIMRLNIPSNAVKAKVIFHVGAHYLLNDLTTDHQDDDDGIEAYAKNFYLGLNKITGWVIEDEDSVGVHTAVPEILQGEVLHGKFVGGHEYDIDQGYVSFSAEVALK